MEQPAGYLASIVMWVAAAASVAVCFRLFVRHIDGRPLLKYEPRRPVPWGAGAAIVLLAPLALAVLNGFASQPPDAPPPAAPQAEDVDRLTLGILSTAATTFVLAIGAYVFLHHVVGVSRRDLGLPHSYRQFGRDALIGLAACVASLLPVYALLTVLQELFESNAQHPLIEQLQAHQSPGMLLASAFAAVIAAPLFEETAFRLLFQGWLERRGTWLRNTPAAYSPGEDIPGAVPASLGDADEADPLAPPREPDPPHDSSVTIFAAENAPLDWPPIVTSSLLFGLAHWGHNVSTSPMILLGAVLGYLYQRTHRIVPCIVCHMAFNSFSLLMLALVLSSQPDAPPPAPPDAVPAEQAAGHPPLDPLGVVR